ITLSSPVDGAMIDNATPITGKVTISGGTTPYSVQFFLDNVADGMPVTSSPYQHNFGALFVGDHSIRATVSDASGWLSNSSPATVHVTGPLGVGLTPTNGSSFSFGQSVVLAATLGGGTAPYSASFYTNGQLAGTVTSAP